MTIQKKLLLASLLMLTFLLGGCIRIQYDATVHLDQSVTLKTTYAAKEHPVARLLNFNPDWEMYAKQAEKNGYAASSFKTKDDYEGLRMEKTFANLEDLASIKDEWKTGVGGILIPPDTTYDVDKHEGFWFNTYRLNTNIDLSIDRLNIKGYHPTGQVKKLADRYIRQADIEIKLHVPEVVALQNAEKIDWANYNDVSWKLYGTKDNQLQLVAYVPNPTGWIITGVVLLIGLGLLTFWIIHHVRKLRRKQLQTISISLLVCLLLGGGAWLIFADETASAPPPTTQIVTESKGEIVPTFMVHGLFGTERTFLPMIENFTEKKLADDGGRCDVDRTGKVTCKVKDSSTGFPLVRIIFEDDEASLAQQQTWLEAAIAQYDKQQKATFTDIQLVGHSMGGVDVVEYTLNENLPYTIRKVVTLDAPIGGSNYATLGLTLAPFGTNTNSPAIQDLAENSKAIERLKARLETWPRDVLVYSFGAKGGDFNLIPLDSSFTLEDYTDNIQTKSYKYDHFTIHRREPVFREVRDFLFKENLVLEEEDDQ
ncbi:alpha/beta hydrolase [Exiguobacterium sp. S90]|uniref:alpha/beta hydrolase n=1 Tax=Exiguobacterium sp. S90 TaxID=1221231 RepID=UPI001BEAA919|nr:alpha/beta hydrolase [Exiguobacterium sp. S90]